MDWQNGKHLRSVEDVQQYTCKCINGYNCGCHRKYLEKINSINWQTMNSVKIIVINEQGRASGLPTEETKPYAAPGIKDGTHMARLQWQFYRMHGGFWVSTDKEVCEQYGDTRQIWVLYPDGEGEKKLPDAIQRLADAIEKSDFKIVFGLQPDQIELIEATINEFGGASVYVFEKVGKQINWEPQTLACHYINYLLKSNEP